MRAAKGRADGARRTTLGTGTGTGTGTGHMIDLAYLFENDLFEPLDAVQAGLSDTVTAYWSRFAATGQMNGHDSPAWKPFTTRAPYVQRLASDRIGPTDFAADHHYAFWKVLAPSQ
ncbi:carboxylesterase family protein [Streptomyces sp. DT20]|uniref:carboxylesterase family protein n=1 Tax=Streptomyces sp. DT20 TaxID=3416519 RepID=UPI003CF781D2